MNFILVKKFFLDHSVGNTVLHYETHSKYGRQILSLLDSGAQ